MQSSVLYNNWDKNCDVTIDDALPKIKLLVVGDSSVGKTCLLMRYVEDSFCPSFITTIGIDFRTKKIDYRGKKFKLQVWDTAGQERFRTITNSFFRGAQGVLLVYDVTNEKTFRNVANWVRSVNQYCTGDVKMVLIANKIDVDEDLRIVSTEQGQRLADEYHIPYFETSAKNSIGVEKPFQSIVQEINPFIGGEFEARKYDGPFQFDILQTREVENKKSSFSCCN